MHSRRASAQLPFLSVPIVSEEVLLGRLRRESQARAAELARLRAELAALGAQIAEKIERLSVRHRPAGGGGAVESSALLESIRRVVAGEGYALAESVERLEARVGDSAAATAEQFLRTKVTADSALAEWGVILTARINQNHAEATTTLQAFADTTSALAEQVTALDTTINDPATGLVVSQASATATLSAHSTQISSVASRTATLEAQVQTPGGGLLARVTSVESSKVDAAGAAAAASTVVSASLTSSAAGSIGAAVTTAAEAYVTPLGEVRANWGVKIDDASGRVLGRIKLDATASTSTLDFEAGTIRLWNGASAVAPFRLSEGVLYLQHVVAETVAAGIHIASPYIQGGELRLAGNCLVCNTSDLSLIRVNGGGGDGPTRGGQIDLFGNSYSTPGIAGSILLTPGQAADATVRIRDRTAADRLIVHATGDIAINAALGVAGSLTAGGALNVGASAQIDHDLAVDGGAEVQGDLEVGGALALGGGATIGDDSLIVGQHKLHFDGTANGTYITESYGLQLWGSDAKPVQLKGAGNELHFGSSAVRLYVSGGELWVQDAAGSRRV